jgi:hypothetical protein
MSIFCSCYNGTRRNYFKGQPFDKIKADAEFIEASKIIMREKYGK